MNLMPKIFIICIFSANFAFGANELTVTSYLKDPEQYVINGGVKQGIVSGAVFKVMRRNRVGGPELIQTGIVKAVTVDVDYTIAAIVENESELSKVLCFGACYFFKRYGFAAQQQARSPQRRSKGSTQHQDQRPI